MALAANKTILDGAASEMRLEQQLVRSAGCGVALMERINAHWKIKLQVASVLVSVMGCYLS